MLTPLPSNLLVLAALSLAAFSFAALPACAPKPPQAPPPAPPPSDEPLSALPLAPDPPILVHDVGFASPESVLYDPVTDLYLVSNVNGGPADQDGNGFISKLAPDGTVQSLRWIEGKSPSPSGKGKDVELDAPKGMALVGSKLYVADINVVRSFDRDTGAPLGDITISDSSFLNDVSAAPDGSLYVSDTGVSKGVELQKNGKDAIYTIDAQGVVAVLIQGEELGQPNGLWATSDGVFVASTSGLVYRVSAQGQRQPVGALPAAGLDGLVLTPEGRLLVSSWEGSSIYLANPPLEANPRFDVLIGDLVSPADLGYDPKRKQLLVPLFKENAVYIQQVL
jgi:hypothetical protein